MRQAPHSNQAILTEGAVVLERFGDVTDWEVSKVLQDRVLRELHVRFNGSHANKLQFGKYSHKRERCFILTRYRLVHRTEFNYLYHFHVHFDC